MVVVVDASVRRPRVMPAPPRARRALLPPLLVARLRATPTHKHHHLHHHLLSSSHAQRSQRGTLTLCTQPRFPLTHDLQRAAPRATTTSTTSAASRARKATETTKGADCHWAQGKKETGRYRLGHKHARASAARRSIRHDSAGRY